jgi:hypothetical protein
MKEDEMGGERSKHDTNKNAYSISIRKLERKRPLLRPEHRWEDNIKMDIKEI